MAVEKKITWKKGEGKQYHLPHNIEAVENNIKCGRGKENEKFREENQDFLKNRGMGKNIEL